MVQASGTTFDLLGFSGTAPHLVTSAIAGKGMQGRRSRSTAMLSRTGSPVYGVSEQECQGTDCVSGGDNLVMSLCAMMHKDLAQYTLAELGVVDEALINRDTDGGTEAWKMGKNLSRIVYQSGMAFVWAKVDRRPKPGDILYVTMPEHVCALEKLDEDAGTISVFEYGQWDAKRQKPSGKRTETKFSVGAKNLKVGSRTLRGWLDIARIPGLLQSPRNNVDSTLIA